MGPTKLWQVMDKALDLQRHSDAAELDPLAHSMDQGEAPLLLTSASPQRPPQQRQSLAASAVSSLTTNSVLLSGSGTGMMTVVKTQFVPLGDSLSDSDSDSEVIALALCSLARTLLFNQTRLTIAMIAICTWSVYCASHQQVYEHMSLLLCYSRDVWCTYVLTPSMKLCVVLQDVRLEQKYGIIRGCRRKASLATSQRGNEFYFVK